MAAGLVKGEGIAVYAIIIEAEAGSKLAIPGDEPHVCQNPALCKRAVREYLEGLDDEVRGATVPWRISLADPQSSRTAAPGVPAFSAYSTNYLIDVAHGVIMDVEATSAHRTAKVESTKLMVDRVETNFNINPPRLIGDTAYGTAPMHAWMVNEKSIEPHIPLWDRTERKDGTFSRSDFRWDREANEYRSPTGKALRCDRRTFNTLRSRITIAEMIVYRACQCDCAGCPEKARCCPNTEIRKIARSIHEDVRNVARDIAKTPQYHQSRCERKKVEMLFAHLKSVLRLDRLRLRGLSGASDEFTLAATVQNLRRLAKLACPLQSFGGIVAPTACEIG